jgi:hypothetical protein
MNNENILIEEYQSSLFKQLEMNESLCIGKALTDGKNVYVFAKEKQTETINGLQFFKEGWRVTKKSPSIYNYLGLSQGHKAVGDYMPTLSSVTGKPKEKYDLTVDAWAGWHMLTCLFNKNNIIVSQGRLLAKDKEKLREEIEGWERLLSSLQGKPMMYVLQHYYSHYELENIQNSTSEQLNLWLSELRTYATELKGDIDTNIHQPLLAKGLFGNAKTINSRRGMRVKFWEQWNMNRTDLFDFARQFTII